MAGLPVVIELGRCVVREKDALLALLFPTEVLAFCVFLPTEEVSSRSLEPRTYHFLILSKSLQYFSLYHAAVNSKFSENYLSLIRFLDVIVSKL